MCESTLEFCSSHLLQTFPRQLKHSRLLGGFKVRLQRAVPHLYPQPGTSPSLAGPPEVLPDRLMDQLTAVSALLLVSRCCVDEDSESLQVNSLSGVLAHRPVNMFVFISEI